MAISVEAIYEDGVLKPSRPLPLEEHARVNLTIRRHAAGAEADPGALLRADPALVDWAALDPELEYPPPPEDR